MEADFIADWNRYWKDVEADIQITLGIEPVEGDEQHVVMRMPFKPEIGQATGSSPRGPWFSSPMWQPPGYARCTFAAAARKTRFRSQSSSARTATG